MNKGFKITEWCQRVFCMQVETGGRYIDATMGNGWDTLFLCGMAGEWGRVWAFDVQQKALDRTRELLKEHGMSRRAELILDSHENMGEYVEPASVDGMFFNFGYLPGGDHGMGTNVKSSIAAVKSGLDLLKKGGMMSLCIYSGGDTGFEEKEALLGLVKNLDTRKFVVILNSYYNRVKNPPVPVFIFKIQE